MRGREKMDHRLMEPVFNRCPDDNPGFASLVALVFQPGGTSEAASSTGGGGSVSGRCSRATPMRVSAIP
jgi:hypothetical protein